MRTTKRAILRKTWLPLHFLLCITLFVAPYLVPWMTDRLVGAALLTGTGVVFTYYTLWVIVMPFVDEDQVYIHALFPDRKFAVALPLLAGFIGLLVIGCFVTVVLLRSMSKQKTS